MKVEFEKINPLFPSAPVINPPLYKFKRRDRPHVDPYELWKEPEVFLSEKKSNGDLFVFSFILFTLIVLFSSS